MSATRRSTFPNRTPDARGGPRVLARIVSREGGLHLEGLQCDGGIARVVTRRLLEEGTMIRIEAARLVLSGGSPAPAPASAPVPAARPPRVNLGLPAPARMPRFDLPPTKVVSVRLVPGRGRSVRPAGEAARSRRNHLRRIASR